ncbi:flagellin [Kineococcus radiotolerans]|uniref:Flagellin n=1 Tax=Kineococcus radiotolerans (strain ATCC BAA-149 / DSM 14245 / SRS30216) TaxID=266940 RepID=A6W8H3_KINRD|nr:flagellin [Kineococcus radiotolerans]ABS03112.1 flagellin domain protein [Kineococcus radiotolerans SRS30216 = ATCC BAA-149]
MGLRINNNIAAVNSYRNLAASDKAMSGSLEKLSSGFRINKAADDAAGLVVSEGLRSQINGMTQAARNAQDGVNVAQTADGALGVSTSILQRMRDLATQAANAGSQDVLAKDAAQKELTQLNAELDRISTTTSFGNTKLLDGTYGVTAKVDGDASTRAVSASNPIEIRSAAVTNRNDVAALTTVSVNGASATLTIASTNLPAKQEFADANAYAAALTTAARTQLTADGGSAAVDGTLTATAAVDKATGLVTISWTQTGGTGPAAGTRTPGGGQSALSGGDAIRAGVDGKVSTRDLAANNILNLRNLKTASGESFGPATGVDVTLDAADHASADALLTAVNAKISSALIAAGGKGDEVVMKNDVVPGGTGYKLSLTSISSDFTLGATTNALGLTSSATVQKGNTGVFQVGANAGETITMGVTGVSSAALGTSSIDLRVNASEAITKISKALDSISSQRASIGAIQNRFEHAVNNLNVSIENITASESAIRDTDMAKEMTKFTKNQILSQAGTSMLAQANSASQNILSLLRG